MAIPEAKKDTMDWQMVAGLDEDGEAQELIFTEDSVKVSFEESTLINAISGMVYALKPTMDEIITELKIMNTHLSIITDNVIGEEDVN